MQISFASPAHTALIVVALLLVAAAARAQGQSAPVIGSTASSPGAQQGGAAERPAPAAPEVRQSSPGGESGVKPAEEIARGILDRSNLLGDWGGRRTRAADHGVTFGLTDIEEVYGNFTGGVRRGAAYEGLTQFGVGIDTEKAFGWVGGTFNFTGYQIHGRGLGLDDLDSNFASASSIEGFRGTLLNEAWYEQTLLNHQIGLRVGQLAADQEFMVSQYAQLFTNETFGWSALASADLPSGGPAYPLGTPALRVRYVPQDDLTAMVGIFDGSPAGNGPRQVSDGSGTAFRLQDGVFAIAEVQYVRNAGDDAPGLPATMRLGGWYNSEDFADMRTDALGRSLADAPAGTVGRGRGGDWSVYAIMDQLLYRPADAKDAGLGSFLRVMGAPGDRNPVNFYTDFGITYKGLLPGREADTVGLAFEYTRISDTAAALDSDIARHANSPYPVRRSESVLELTYQVQIAPWWQVQPSAQYIFNINGGVPNPMSSTKRVGDAAVLGVRTTITF